MNRRECLDVAATCVLSDRNKEYGGPEHSFGDISAMWSVILRKKVTTADVALCMIALKTARLIDNPTHQDSWIDIAGYAACGAEVATCRDFSGGIDDAGIFPVV